MKPMKIQAWSNDDYRRNCNQRLQYAKTYRKNLCEERWSENERLMYYAALNEQSSHATIEELEGGTDEDFDVEIRDVALNFIFRDVRYMHAQMSANPPTIKVIPGSVDADDEERAEAADLTARWAREEYDLHEVSDNRNLKTLTKGTGYIRWLWDATLGRMLKFGEEDGLGKDEFVMSGDLRVYSPSTWAIWLDPDARTQSEVKWYFEEIQLSIEEAQMRWPEYADKIKALSTTPASKKWRFWTGEESRSDRGQNQVSVYVYVEKGLPVNGMQGRYCMMLEGDDGCILECGANPNADAGLGLDILTDIDVEDQVYGKSIIEYLDKVQAVIQAIDANALQNIAAHNTIRMYVSDDAEVDDEGVTNSSVDVIRGKPGQQPNFIAPPALMPDAWKFRDQLFQGSREISMINESMLGQSSRETSGYTTQLQVNQGNMGRRRLFNKFARSTKNIFWGLLGEIIENWTEPRLVRVLGVERAYEAKTFQGSDIEGNWDIFSEYGQNFSLDPNTARDQIMQLMPLFEKIPGFDYRSLVDAVRLNVMDNFVDKLALAKRKQRKVFKKMIHNFDKYGVSAYIKPEELEDHENMIVYGRVFVMTTEYEVLDKGLRGLIDQHIKEREQIVAQKMAEAQQAQAPAQGAPQAAPQGLPPGMAM